MNLIDALPRNLTLTHRQEQDNGEYDDITIADDIDLVTMLRLVASSIPQDMIYQYYVTKWDGDTIIQQDGLQSWIDMEDALDLVDKVSGALGLCYPEYGYDDSLPPVEQMVGDHISGWGHDVLFWKDGIANEGTAEMIGNKDGIWGIKIEANYLNATRESIMAGEFIDPYPDPIIVRTQAECDDIALHIVYNNVQYKVALAKLQEQFDLALHSTPDYDEHEFQGYLDWMESHD